MVILMYYYAWVTYICFVVLWALLIFNRQDFRHYAEKSGEVVDGLLNNINTLNSNQKVLNSNLEKIEKQLTVINKNAKTQENSNNQTKRSIRPH